MIRVFPNRNKWTPTDELAFIGDPPMFRPTEQPVRVSVTFTWDIQEGKRLFRAWSKYYSDVNLGGPAFGDPGGTFVPGRYIKEGVTFTSRGCVRRCPWCVVPTREGKIRELPIIDGWIIQDNNFLACSQEHQEKVFEMCQRQKQPITFSGGLDGKLLKPWHIEWFKALKIKEMWFACDDSKNLKTLEKSADLLSDFSQHKKRCYVLFGFNGETPIEAEKRIEKVYELGFLPFAQLYRSMDNKEQYNYQWRSLARKWSRPAAYRSAHKL